MCIAAVWTRNRKAMQCICEKGHVECQEKECGLKWQSERRKGGKTVQITIITFTEATRKSYDTVCAPLLSLPITHCNFKALNYLLHIVALKNTPKLFKWHKKHGTLDDWRWPLFFRRHVPNGRKALRSHLCVSRWSSFIFHFETHTYQLWETFFFLHSM